MTVTLVFTRLSSGLRADSAVVLWRPLPKQLQFPDLSVFQCCLLRAGNHNGQNRRFHGAQFALVSLARFLLTCRSRFGRISRGLGQEHSSRQVLGPDKQRQMLSCAECTHSCHGQGQSLPGLTKWLGGGLRGGIIASCFHTARQNCTKNRTSCKSPFFQAKALRMASAGSQLFRQVPNCQPLEVATFYVRVLHTSHAQLDARAHEAP
jgi:hypothetical protein